VRVTVLRLSWSSAPVAKLATAVGLGPAGEKSLSGFESRREHTRNCIDAGMLNPSFRLAVNFFAWFFELVAYAVLLWTGSAISMDSNDQVFGKVIDRTKHFAPYLVIGCGAFTLVARLGRWSVAEKSRPEILIDQLVSKELGKMRKACFQGLSQKEPRENNRVTIFKRVGCKWRIKPWKSSLCPWGRWRHPWSGWLVVTHRSGHTMQSGTAVFLAPDDATHAEGVAGQAWRSDGAVRVRDLPNLSGLRYVGRLRCGLYWIRWLIKWQGPGCDRYWADRETVGKYATAGHMTARLVWKRIKAGRQNPNSILAVPLETPDNVRWGVLVIDSSNAVECIDTEQRAFREALSRLKSALARYDITRI
jgi:hypothetical protein